MKVACVLVTHLRAKVELRRQPHLRDRPAVIVDRSGGRPLVVDRFPSATGVAAGMTLEQAMSRHVSAIVLDADEPSYRGAFNRMLASLQGVSDRVERSDLGAAYVRLDGLEDMYGGEARLVTALLNCVPQDMGPRVGVAGAKFPALVAALASTPLGATRVPPDAASFLAPRSLDLLPIASTVKAAMRRFGLHTMGEAAAMSRDMLAEQFGPAGGRAWDLSHGIDNSPLVPLKHEETVVERASLPFSSTSMPLLLAAVDTLLRRAYSRPRMRGRYAGSASLECVLDRASPWEKSFHFKQSAGSSARAYFIISNRLETDHPQAPVEEVSLALSDLTGESGTFKWDCCRTFVIAGSGALWRWRDSSKPARGQAASCAGWQRWPPGTPLRRCAPCRSLWTRGEERVSSPYPLQLPSRSGRGRMESPSRRVSAIAGTEWPTSRTRGASTCGGCPVPSPAPTTG